MIIGNFKYDPAKDSYAGEIKTLTLLRGKVHFRPAESKSDKAPHYRVVVEGQPGSVELGAAWKRRSEAGREFLSVRLDDGPHMTPKGLRHSFGIHAIRSGVPLNLVKRWLGHASMTTTEIYLDAMGDEEREIAARMWPA
jgi:uncharacterized protein (DUF736 family)